MRILIIAGIMAAAIAIGAERPAPKTPEDAAFAFYMSREWAKRSGHDSDERYRDYLEWLIQYRKTEESRRK